MDVHCPVCTQQVHTCGQISYVIRSHVDQNTQESRTTARVTKENGPFAPKKGTVLIKKKDFGDTDLIFKVTNLKRLKISLVCFLPSP